MKKRLVRFGAIALLALIIAGAAVFWSISGKGSGKVEQWIGSQILSIANAYLNPKLTFTDLDYTYPLSVSLKNMHLTAADPAHPGQTIDLIACESAGITLGEIPKIGKPIIIEKISLNKPLISAVAVATRSHEFIGFSNLLKPGTLSDKPADQAAKPAGAPMKLSEVFRMRLVQLVDGKIVYDPRIAGTLPMALDQINTTLNIDSSSDGWYKLNTLISRKPVFDLAVLGELNLDTFTVRGIDIKLLAELGQEKMDYLPPELQALLKQYDGKGKLNVAIIGTMPVMEPMKGQMSADVKLDSAHVAMGDFHLPVDKLELQANFADGKVTIPSIKIAALGGTADLSGSATLNDRLDADLSLKVSGMVLENLLKAGPSKNAAKLDLDFKVAGALMAIIGKVPPIAGQPLAAISVQNFRLSAADPANAGQTVDVLAVKNLDVALAEPVLAGKPIVIEKIILDQPVLSAISVTPSSFQFVGVPNLPPSLTNSLTAPSAGAATLPTTAPAAPVAVAAGAGVKPASDSAPPSPTHTPPDATSPARASLDASPKLLSDLIRVKTFQLNNAKLVYDPRIAGTQRMWLDGINTSLNVDPADPGVYVLSTAVGRKPVFDLTVAGRINIDHPGVENLNINLLADLTQGQTDFLVPQVQALLAQTQAKGRLTFALNGSVPLQDLGKAKLHAESRLDQVDVAAAGSKLPVSGFTFNADVADGVLQIRDVAVNAAGSTFNISGSTNLTGAFDTNLTLQLAGVPLEKVLAAIQPNQKPLTTLTLLNADVNVTTSLLAAAGLTAAKSGQPLVAVNVKNARLSTSDPTAPAKQLDFLACDNLAVSLSQLPSPGRPIVIDSIVANRAAVRAVAMEPGLNQFAGVVNFQKMAGAFSPTTQPGDVAPAAPTPPAQPIAAKKLSDLIHIGSVQVNDATLYYDPRLTGTTAMSFDHIAATLTPASPLGDSYTFTTVIPRKPDFNLDVKAGVNVDNLTVSGLQLSLTADLSKHDASYFPPQIQQLLKQYDVVGTLNVAAAGGLPISDPTAADLTTDVTLDNVKATAADYRLPIDHVKLPAHLKNHQIEILPADAMGGPMVDALHGTADLTGTVLLDEWFTSTLKLAVNNMLLQDLSAAKIHPDPSKDLIGILKVDVLLKNAPLLVVAAHGVPAQANPTTQPLYAYSKVALPEQWGNGEVHVTEARLAGLELIQKLGNFAKSAVFEITKQFDKEKALTIKPKENAHLVFAMGGDKVAFSEVQYEGEIVAVEGNGVFNLNQLLDFNLKGGPWGKLGALVKNNVNSLLTYHITGPASDPKFDVTTGDGKVIGDEVKDLASKAGEGVGKGIDATKKGLDKAGGFLGGLFKKKDGD